MSGSGVVGAFRRGGLLGLRGDRGISGEWQEWRSTSVGLPVVYRWVVRQGGLMRRRG